MNNHGVYFPDTNRGQALSGKQLLQVAETLGQEWKRAGICLGLSTTDLDDIKAGEADVTMQKMKMLELWQCRILGKATAQDLLRGLEDLKDLPVDTRGLLRGNALHPQSADRVMLFILSFSPNKKIMKYFFAKTTHTFRINCGFLTDLACESSSFNQIQSGTFMVVHLVTNLPGHEWYKMAVLILHFFHTVLLHP